MNSSVHLCYSGPDPRGGVRGVRPPYFRREIIFFSEFCSSLRYGLKVLVKTPPCYNAMEHKHKLGCFYTAQSSQNVNRISSLDLDKLRACFVATCKKIQFWNEKSSIFHMVVNFYCQTKYLVAPQQFI